MIANNRCPGICILKSGNRWWTSSCRAAERWMLNIIRTATAQALTTFTGPQYEGGVSRGTAGGD
ncbi:MAG: hypothetical protein IT290_00715 [Deltaproteobacteria bacterium]|nr:hypothetical protein [Deltaproteobacteria bacterium]